MEKQKSIKKNAFLNTIKTFLTLFFPLVTFPYSSRILGPAILGEVNFAQSIVSYFSAIATLGLSSYAVREVAKLRDDKEKLNTLIKELLTINLLSTIVAYVLLFLSLIFIKRLNNSKSLIIICSSLIMFTTFGLNWLYEAFEEFTYITIRSLIFQAISVVLLFTLVKTKNDYLEYAAVNIISNVGANICNLIHARKFISLRKSHMKLQIKRHLKPVFILFASGIATTFFTSLDTSMLGFLCTNEQIGYYSAGAKLVRMIRNLFPAITAVIIPRISYYISQNDKKSINELCTKTFKLLFCFAPPLSMGFLLLMKPLVLLFCGQLYLDAILVSKIMCPFIVCSGISYFTCGLLVVFGKEKGCLYRILIAAFIDFVLNFILIPKYGANGAAVATLFSEIGIVVFDCLMLKDFLKDIKLLKQILQFFIALCIMSLCVYFASSICTNLWFKLVTGTVAGVLSYGIILLLLRNDFLLYILEKLKGKIKK